MAQAISQLVSVHDVMPETLGKVVDIVRTLEESGQCSVTLLVVPGRDWQGRHLDTLRRFVAAGHTLAGHGWSHQIKGYRNLSHRLHGLLISRNVAEHLEHDAAGIRALIGNCRSWFDEQKLPAPEFYVPPAWAMGRIKKPQLGGLGFRYFEYLSGIYDAETGDMRRIPLLGFEADTGFRAAFLRLSNRVNRAFAVRSELLRVAIHPSDPDLLLAADLARCLVRENPADGSAIVHENFSRR